jgi:phosphoribosyl 1,2-cyclic phosphodiesterase
MTLDKLFSESAGGCSTPGCNCKEVQLRPLCHPSAGTTLLIDSSVRTLTVSCAACDKLIAKVECPFVN